VKLRERELWMSRVVNQNKQYNKYVSDNNINPHMPIVHPHGVRISSTTFMSAHLYGTINRTSL